MEMYNCARIDILAFLPQRLLMRMDSRDVDKFVFAQAKSHGITCVMASDCLHSYIGVAVKSEHDKYNPEIGLRIALCRCLRSAGLLPEAKRQKRNIKRETPWWMNSREVGVDRAANGKDSTAFVIAPWPRGYGASNFHSLALGMAHRKNFEVK